MYTTGSLVAIYFLSISNSHTSTQWSYGVTCWEVFNGGKTPYPGVDPLCLAGLLDSGYRMERPQNAACSDEMLAS